MDIDRLRGIDDMLEKKEQKEKWYNKGDYELRSCMKCGKGPLLAIQSYDDLLYICMDCYNQLPEGKYKWPTYKKVKHQPTASEIEQKQRSDKKLEKLRKKFSKKYIPPGKDEARVKAYGEAHRNMISLGDIETQELRNRARPELERIYALETKEFWPEFDYIEEGEEK